MAKTFVLLVEDDRPVRETLRDALEMEGYEVRSVENGRQALQALAERRPDVIVLDLMMPTMDGWQFRRVQRQMARDVPILVISAAPDPRLDDLRPDAFLSKPFDLDMLLIVLRDILRAKGRELAS
jgi:two-component system response regulator MprA